MITHFTIFGERCSGTTYIENLMLLNFNVTVTWKYGAKHFFGHSNELLKDSDNTLFICIVRDPIDWLNSFYRTLHHLPLKYMEMDENSKIDTFLNNEIWSFDDNKKNRDTSKEIMADRNIYTGERYKNIFEMRHTKIKFLLEDLPTKVKNYIFIRHEDICNDFYKVMNAIYAKGLTLKDKNNFPINTSQYKNNKNKIFNGSSPHIIPQQLIENNPHFEEFNLYEKQLGYL